MNPVHSADPRESKHLPIRMVVGKILYSSRGAAEMSCVPLLVVFCVRKAAVYRRRGEILASNSDNGDPGWLPDVIIVCRVHQ